MCRKCSNFTVVKSPLTWKHAHNKQWLFHSKGKKMKALRMLISQNIESFSSKLKNSSVQGCCQVYQS